MDGLLLDILTYILVQYYTKTLIGCHMLRVMHQSMPKANVFVQSPAHPDDLCFHFITKNNNIVHRCHCHVLSIDLSKHMPVEWKSTMAQCLSLTPALGFRSKWDVEWQTLFTSALLN